MMAASFLGKFFGLGARKRAANADALRPGALFRHVTPRGTVEIARIASTGTDGFGIHHINFTLTFRYHGKEVEAGHRTLSAAGFLSRFPALEAPAPAVKP